MASAASSRILVTNSTSSGASTGVYVDGAAVDVAASVDNVTVLNSPTGISASNGSSVTVSNSLVSGAGSYAIRALSAAAPDIYLAVVDSTTSHSARGVHAATIISGSASVKVVTSNNFMAGNGSSIAGIETQQNTGTTKVVANGNTIIFHTDPTNGSGNGILIGGGTVSTLVDNTLALNKLNVSGGSLATLPASPR